MKLLKEHREEFCHTGALDNVPEQGIRGFGMEAWVDIVEQSLGTKNYALLY